MKALIRGNEVITEPFPTWVQNNLAFLTGNEKDAEGNPLPGDGWKLVDNYVPPEDVEGDGHVPTVVTEEEEPDYVEINGVKYFKH